MTVIFGGVVAALVTFFLSLGRDQATVMREKAEEFFIAAEAYERMLGGYSVAVRGTMKGGGSIDDPVVAESLRDSNGGTNKAKMQMFARFYFPSVEPFVARHEAARANMISVIGKVERREAALFQFDAACEEREEAGRDLLAAIAVEGRRHAGFDPLSGPRAWVAKVTQR